MDGKHPLQHKDFFYKGITAAANTVSGIFIYIPNILLGIISLNGSTFLNSPEIECNFMDFYFTLTTNCV